MENAIYTFRKLKSTDIFLMVQIINKIGVAELKGLLDKDSIKNIVESVIGNENATKDAENKTDDKTDVLTQIGISLAFDVATIILKNLPKCETDIYEMLANVTEKDVNFIKNLDMDVFFGMIIDFCKKDEFKDFLKVVSKFLK
jgi:hypothetical protein